MAHTLDINTQNNDVGLYISKSRRAVVGTNFGQLATWIKAQTSGTVVYQNTRSGEIGVWELESGELAPIVCDIILTSSTIDGVLETTTAAGLLWGVSGASLIG